MSNEESFATQEPVEVVLISEEDGDAIEAEKLRLTLKKKLQLTKKLLMRK